MGIERTISHDPNVLPDWAVVRGLLVANGETATLRMIDGMPAFPDEIPDATWHELRIGMTGGMVTVKRRVGQLVCVTWGNGEPALVRSWNLLNYGLTKATNGTIQMETGPMNADDFAKSVGIHIPSD